MSDIATIASVLNVLGLGGLGLFLYYVVKGLKERVANLTELAKEQKDTLEAVRTRALEIDRLSKDYKQALTDFQDMGKKLDERRNELVKELEFANQRKDQELAKLAHLELEEIDLKKKSLERLPALERRLDETVTELGRQLRIVAPPAVLRISAKPASDLWRNLLAHHWVGPSEGKSERDQLALWLLSSKMNEWVRTQNPGEGKDAKEPENEPPVEETPDEKTKDDPDKAG